MDNISNYISSHPNTISDSLPFDESELLKRIQNQLSMSKTPVNATLFNNHFQQLSTCVSHFKHENTKQNNRMRLLFISLESVLQTTKCLRLRALHHMCMNVPVYAAAAATFNGKQLCISSCSHADHLISAMHSA